MSFTAAANPTADRTWMQVLILSFTTLSSTGNGDVLPVKRARSSIEMLSGLAYVAGLVSRLAGLMMLCQRRH